ncbi:MAG: response regulator [Acetobacteraceae bacterium]
MERLGYRAAHAANGRQAVGWLEANPPPLMILLDLLMPEMDGFAFLERLRTKPDWHDIPVIVVTAKQLTTEERQWLGQDRAAGDRQRPERACRSVAGGARGAGAHRTCAGGVNAAWRRILLVEDNEMNRDNAVAPAGAQRPYRGGLRWTARRAWRWRRARHRTSC